MTDEIELLRKVLQKHDQVSRLKRINEELYAHLTGSIHYLLRYSEKYNMPLPQKEALLGMIEKSDFIIDQFTKSNNREGTGTTSPKREQNLFKGVVQIEGHRID